MMRRSLLTMALVACVAAAGAPPPELAPDRPRGPFALAGPMGAIAPRDSLDYTLSWPRVPGNSAYRVTVAALATVPAGTWAGLPTSAVVSDTFLRWVAINSTFDSVRFQVRLWGRRGARETSASRDTAWSVVRLPGLPPNLQLDSSRVPLEFSLAPRTAGGDTLWILGPGVPSLSASQPGSRATCAYFALGGGRVALRSQDQAACGADYAARFTVLQRTISTVEQAVIDQKCVEWTASSPVVTLVAGGCDQVGMRTWDGWYQPLPVRVGLR